VVDSGDEGGTVRTWHIPQDGDLPQSISTDTGESHSINSLTLSSDGRLLIFSSTVVEDLGDSVWEDCIGVIYIAPTTKGAYEHHQFEMFGHTSGVTSVDFHPSDANLAASVSKDGTVKTWNLSPPLARGRPFQFSCRATIQTHVSVQAIFSPDGSNLTSCGSDLPYRQDKEDHCIRSWSAYLQLEPTHYVKVDMLILATDGESIASVGTDRILIWDLTVRCRDILEEEPVPVQIWDDNGPVTFSTSSMDGISTASFSPCGKLITGGGAKGRIAIWNLKGGEEQEHPFRPVPLCCGQDPSDGYRPGHEHKVRTLVFSPNTN
jgi:WD40 repeat protein